MAGYMMSVVVLLDLVAFTATRPLAQRAEPPRSVWVLRRLAGESVPPSSPEAATLVLGNHHLVGGTAACNSFIGAKIRWFSARPNSHGSFKIDVNESMPWTVMRCRDDLALKTGGRFWSTMQSARTWSMTATTLTIGFADGSSSLLATAPAP